MFLPLSFFGLTPVFSLASREAPTAGPSGKTGAAAIKRAAVKRRNRLRFKAQCRSR